MLGNTLITKQIGESGIKCNAVYIVEGLTENINRKNQAPVCLASSEGGEST